MRTLIAAALVLGLVGLTAAQDKKADPTGTWKWETERNGQKRETTLKLKLDGDKLTGTITAGRREGRRRRTRRSRTGSSRTGEVTFTVTREFNDQKFVTQVQGEGGRGHDEGDEPGPSGTGRSRSRSSRPSGRRSRTDAAAPERRKPAFPTREGGLVAFVGQAEWPPINEKDADQDRSLVF